MKPRNAAVAFTISTACLVAVALALAGSSARAAEVLANLLAFDNGAGQSRTFNSAGILNPDNPFFQDLGTNGRACVTCHQAAEGWTITPAGVQQRFAATDGLDPIFRTNDGSNCAGADISTLEARTTAFSLLMSRGLIRVELPVPFGAEFTIEAVDDPYGCGAATSSASLYRRPLPATNLRFLSAIMWDGRESPSGVSMRDGLTMQAKDATIGHAEASMTPTDVEVRKIVDFELGLHTAQSHDSQAGGLGTQRATGGPVPLSRVPFFIGINDPLGLNPTGAPFDARAFTLFNAWQSLGSGAEPLAAARGAIARGQAIFNSRPMDITGVSGLNDELNVASIGGTCTTCHDTPNVGNHSVAAPLNIGVTEAAVRTPDMPLYTLRNLLTGEAKQTTDPGRAMITGKWKDIGRFKGPILRGLAGRAPYFHNGLAATLGDVVDFYDTRFGMGLTQQEKADLVAFLGAL
jgi:cytochrome c peroxidase